MEQRIMGQIVWPHRWFRTVLTLLNTLLSHILYGAMELQPIVFITIKWWCWEMDRNSNEIGQNKICKSNLEYYMNRAPQYSSNKTSLCISHGPATWSNWWWCALCTNANESPTIMDLTTTTTTTTMQLNLLPEPELPASAQKGYGLI